MDGSLAKPADLLRTMLASVPAFQTFVGIGSAAAALGKIHLKHINVENDSRPYASISPGVKHGYRQVAGGSRVYLRPFGSLFLYMARDVAAGDVDDPLAAEFDAAEVFGLAIDGLMAISGEDDNLAITGCEMVVFGTPSEAEVKSLGHFYFCGYHLEWGEGG